MKGFIIGSLITAGIVLGMLNIHIIRTEKSFEFTSKDEMTFKDTYADVRRWDLAEYFSHAPKIRNYLLEKKYESLSKKVNEAKKELKDKTDKTVEKTKEKLDSVFDKISEKLK